MTPAFSICVYCGSRPGARPEYTAAATAVGRWIGEHHGQLVYGGGARGLMGALAGAALAAGARVVGIIPQALIDKEQAQPACTELHVVGTMHERKRLMAERSDAFLALPGGIGTFEEFFEAWTWRQLGYHDKPVGLLNIGGYYDRLIDFLGVAVHQQFMDPWQMTLMREDDDPAALLRELIQSAGLSPQPRLDAM